MEAKTSVNDTPHEMRFKQLNVIVLGGGIGGLSTALALRRQGHTVEVRTVRYLASEAIRLMMHIRSLSNLVFRTRSAPLFMLSLTQTELFSL